jgi:hemoglobin
MNEHQFHLIRDSLMALEGRATETADAFYLRLFRRLPELRALFRDDETVMRGKFANMLAVFGHAKRMDKLLPALRTLGKRHGGYGAQAEHFEVMGEALWAALTEVLGARFTPDVEYAWRMSYMEIAEHMRQYMGEQAAPTSPTDTGMPENLLERIGGREVLERVHRRFYRDLFDDKWLGRFFWGKDLETLVTKQTDFMYACLGGPNHYRGETPAIAHMHMFVTDEIFDVRQAILRKAIEAEGLSSEVADAWLRADGVFRPGIAKHSVDECVMRCRGQMPIVAEKPKGYKAPGSKGSNRQ